MAEIHGSPGAVPQMPAAPGSGPAPVPYAGMDLSPEPPLYHADMGPLTDAAGAVMAGVTNLGTVESPAAHDISAGPGGGAPYFPGQIDPIFTGADNDAGGRSPIAGDVAASVSNATARWQELQGDTYGQGSTIGDLMDLDGLADSAMTPALYDPPGDLQPPSGSFL